MTHTIGVIGGGAAGQYMAIRLAQKGYRVFVVDPIAGEPTRPGKLGTTPFTLAAQNITQHIAVSSNSKLIQDINNVLLKDLDQSKHIKDFEKALYKIANEHYKIPFYKKYFLSADKTSVTIADKSGENPETIPCSLLIDATGNARSVVKFANQVVSSPPFEIVRFSDTPTKKHFIAFVKMSPNDIQKLKNPPKTKYDTQHEMGLMYYLQNEYGWDYLTRPEFVSVLFNEKNKVLLYGECPQNLQKEKLEEWIQMLLNMEVEQDTIPYRLDHHKKTADGQFKKPVFQMFSIDSNMLKTPLYFGDEIVKIIAVGDAFIPSDYRLGKSIENSIHRIEIVLSHLQTNEAGFILGESEKFITTMKNNVDEQKKELDALYEERKQIIDRDAKAIERIYDSLFSKRPVHIADPELQKETFIKALDWQYQKAMQLKRIADNELAIIRKQTGDLIHASSVGNMLDIYAQAIELLNLSDIEPFLEQRAKIHARLVGVNNSFDNFEDAYFHGEKALETLAGCDFAGQKVLEEQVMIQMDVSLVALGEAGADIAFLHAATEPKIAKYSS
jgi:hypothetical protein